MGKKKIFHVNGKLKGAGVVVLISDKIDYKSKIVIGGKGSYYINDQRINSARRYDNYKYIVPNTTAPKCKANIDRSKWRNK